MSPLAPDDLAAVPAQVQSELARLHTWIHAMTQHQRESALAVICAVIEAFVSNTGGKEYQTIRMLEVVSSLIQAVDQEEYPRQEAVS